MSVSSHLIRTHIDYNAWATLRLLNAAAELTPDELTHDFQTADRSVLGTLTHLFGSDRIWLNRLTGGSAANFVTDGDGGLAALRNGWPALLEHWQTWAAKLSDEQVLAPIDYSDLKGRPWKQPLWQLILHAVNHGTHHRGQVSGFLRSLGHTPPPLDLVHYYRLQG